jgi:hypothetical protein
MNLREIDEKIKSLSNFNKRVKREISKMKTWIEQVNSSFHNGL